MSRLVFVAGCMYLQDDEELVTRLSLHHYFLAVLKLYRLQGISHCQALPLVQRLCSGATLGQHLVNTYTHLDI